VREHATTTEVLSPSPRRRRQVVLVVDDEPEIAELTAEVLADDGFEVDTAENGLAALEKLKARRYDLIVSDLNMPGLDGPGLYREVAERFPHLAPRMLFVTGNIFTDDTAEFFAVTGARCVRKPYALADVRRAVRQVLDRHK
jgi:CheY-like chemotaxis protein